VLTLSPTELSRECGLSILLPVGRLNGLHNMITVIQNQISSELNRRDVDQIDQVIKVDEFSKVSSSKGDESMSNEIDSSDEIAVLLSGGVDSSVALKLLQLQVLKIASNMIVQLTCYSI
jgi:asparagine synthetase B (glutamine-hydrolysing)